MLLTPEKSLCNKNQSKIVSKDMGTSREHRAINPERKYDVRHYQLDGDLVKNETCCDFLVLNDTEQKAYFIELKGRNIDDAISQLEAGVNKFKNELKNYTILYRLVCSKVNTHDVKKNSFRKFQDRHGLRFKYKTNVMEEIL